MLTPAYTKNRTDPVNTSDPLGLRTLDEDVCAASGGVTFDAENSFCYVPTSLTEGAPCAPSFDPSGSKIVVFHNGQCQSVEVVDTCGVHSVRQEGVNFAGGVLSVISFGVGKHLRGINEKTCGDSNWYTAGNVAGLTIIAGGGAVVEAPAAGGSGSQAVVGLTGLGNGGGEGAINAVASASSTGAIFDFGIGQVNYFIFEGEKPSTCTNMNALLALAYGPSLFLDDVAQLFANMFALSSSAALNADCDDAYE